ncbi:MULTISPECIES: ParB/Srx family N-terminal domain-containing protein [unclassified Gilliamella]|uniref:ParB/Srx family N-terminal domain-containing protein n=1 Tax=unclassified Gilliamella TaxID=2685620 RepID=UPI0013264DD5|nr:MULTISPECIES: ParB/Srx family N-terminal domain-containing protein [unclassified Gilliamella]MWN31001.1 chromosome partitioning protein ParB [Gilliamella sp. Pra-s60]MWP28434.1 chromosome partitioning protein ParB [Gilliamella sp. Pra-s54]
MNSLKITYKKVSDLKKHIKNSRTHSDDQIQQIINSIIEFGWTNPILIDENDIIIAGHGRLDAAEKLNLDEAPCVVLSGLTDVQKKAYLIADNQLALNAGWDFDILQAEIAELTLSDFDISLLGFSDSELNNMNSKTEIDYPDSFSECDETNLTHKCPRCGFEYD